MLELIVTDFAGTRLDRWLVERLPERSRNQIQQDIEAGRVIVGGQPRPARYRVAEGDCIQYDLPAIEPTRVDPEPIALNIRYEDAHLIVIDKPAGLVVHPAPGHASGTLVNALLHHCGPSLEGVGGQDRWGIVHRLDAQTSGLMVAAKTPEAYDLLVEALARRAIRRFYVGIAVGSFMRDDGTVNAPIGRRTSDRKKMGVRADGRSAATDWHLICQSDGLALLGLTLHTGRTHQIRVHLQSIGRPILGDLEYGWTRPRTFQAIPAALRPPLVAIWPARQMLHAARLAFDHPIESGQRIDLRSEPLPDMTAVLDAVWPGLWRKPLEEWLCRPLPELEPADESDEIDES